MDKYNINYFDLCMLGMIIWAEQGWQKHFPSKQQLGKPWQTLLQSIIRGHLNAPLASPRNGVVAPAITKLFFLNNYVLYLTISINSRKKTYTNTKDSNN